MGRFLLIFLWGMLALSDATAQSAYVIKPLPDLWYNSVDGVRLGVRARGQLAGTFGDGPHRLDAGIWIGSKWPKHPISYYLSLTEPVPAWSDFGSEAAFTGYSSIREGLSNHGISFSKQIRHGFDERDFSLYHLETSFYKRIDHDYLYFPNLWQNKGVFFGSASFTRSKIHSSSTRYQLFSSISAGKVHDEQAYLQYELELKTITQLSRFFAIRSRFFSGITSARAPVEKKFSYNGLKPYAWISSGFTRSRGTLPVKAIQNGDLSVHGNAGIRGYSQFLTHGLFFLEKDIVHAISLELDYPNPVSWALQKVSILRDIMEPRAYLFAERGGNLTRPISSAGAGVAISVTLPARFGETSRLYLQYDAPLWVSHPQNEQSAWKFRSIWGIGSITSF